MRYLNWLTFFGFLGLAIVQIQAQPASQEQIERARDILRNTRVEQPAAATRPAVGTNASIPNIQPTPGSTTVPPGGIGTLTSEREKQARELLQNMRNQPRPAAFPTQKSSPLVEQTDAAAREAARQQALAEARRVEEEKRIAAEKSLTAGQQNNIAPATDRERRMAEIEAAVARAKQERAAAARAASAPPAITEPVGTAPPAVAVVPNAPAATGPATPSAVPAATSAVAAPAAPVAAPAAPPLQVPSPQPPGLTPEQEQKARELLNQKLNEFQLAPPVVTAPSPAAPSAVAPPSAVTPPPAPVTPPPPVVAAPPAAAAPVVSQPQPAAASTLTADKEGQVRALLDQKVAELYAVNSVTQPPPPITAPPAVAPPPTVPAEPAVAPTPAVAQVPVPVVSAAPRSPSSPPPPFGTLTPEAEAQARELLQKQWDEINVAKSSVPAEDPQKKAGRQTEKATAEAKEKARAEARKRTEAEAQSIAASRAREQGADKKGGSTASAEPLPANLLSGNKQQRLVELLETYKQNKIGPAEYHERRAKILAEP